VRGAGLEARGLGAEQIDIVSTHATGTTSGDSQECDALRRVFGGSKKTCFNNTKSFIGHSMGAAGALELAGNLGAFEDGSATRRSTSTNWIRNAN
jgi:3-oxoacyl-[acyl-carrier-protein] synthase II